MLAIENCIRQGLEGSLCQEGYLYVGFAGGLEVYSCQEVVLYMSTARRNRCLEGFLRSISWHFSVRLIVFWKIISHSFCECLIPFLIHDTRSKPKIVIFYICIANWQTPRCWKRLLHYIFRATLVPVQRQLLYLLVVHLATRIIFYSGFAVCWSVGGFFKSSRAATIESPSLSKWKLRNGSSRSSLPFALCHSPEIAMHFKCWPDSLSASSTFVGISACQSLPICVFLPGNESSTHCSFSPCGSLLSISATGIPYPILSLTTDNHFSNVRRCYKCLVLAAST